MRSLLGSSILRVCSIRMLTYLLHIDNKTVTLMLSWISSITEVDGNVYLSGPWISEQIFHCNPSIKSQKTKSVLCATAPTPRARLTYFTWQQDDSPSGAFRQQHGQLETHWLHVNNCSLQRGRLKEWKSFYWRYIDKIPFSPPLFMAIS